MILKLNKNPWVKGIVFLWIFMLPMFSSVQKTCADVSIETEKCRVVLGNDAHWRSIIDKSTGRELCVSDAMVPFAEITTEKGTLPASSLKRVGRNLQVGFKGSDTRLTYGLTTCDDWIHFQLTIVDGHRPQKIVLCQVPIAITENVGSLLNITWDERTSVCLMTANFQSTCRPSSRNGYALLQATTQDAPGPPLEGAAVALIVGPTSGFKNVLRTASHMFGLLINEDYEGIPAKDTSGLRSYWFPTRVKESDADKIIEYCRKTNFNQVIILFHSWARSAGHIDYNTDNFPDGKESIKRFVKKLNDAGIGVGSHTYITKISKTDRYVTPVPDGRFWVDMETVLATDIDSKVSEIKMTTGLREWPGSPVCSKKRWEGGVVRHQEVIIGDEIIKYKSIGPEGKYDTFFGCERGAWGTRAATHKSGDRAIHWGIDGGINAYIIDQETELLDEVCKRMADVFNYCGFNMVYFDGAEDIPRTRYSYYASLAQYRVLKMFRKKPFIHMGGGRTHRLWHSYTIVSTVDTYMNTLRGAILSGRKIDQWPTVKSHINRSVNSVKQAHKNLISGEMGWFGIWSKGENTDGLQLDEIEYLMVKSLAYNAPISLETSWAQMDSHPLTPEILNIVGAYEKIRIDREVPENICEKLKEQNKDFAYIRTGNTYEFVEVSELPEVAGTHDIRSFAGEMKNGDAVATIWHYLGESGTVRLPSSTRKVKAFDFFGNEVELKKKGRNFLIPAGSGRLTLIFSGISKESAVKLLGSAELE